MTGKGIAQPKTIAYASSIFIFILTSAPTAVSAPPVTAGVGTWSTIPNTSLLPALPLEMTGCTAFNPGCGVPELWKSDDIFASSGGDVAVLNGVSGMWISGGGHAGTPDNSLYWIPFDGSGAKRLMGPYLAPDGVYKYNSPWETYRDCSRNQRLPSSECGKALKSTHTYNGVVTVQVNGKPQFLRVTGGVYTGSGGGSQVVRMFDPALTYAQAMARGDMGWREVAPTPDWTMSNSCAWDAPQKRAVCRMRTSFGAFYPDSGAGRWERWGGTAGGSDFEAGAAIDPIGRKMYVVGDRLAEVIDLSKHTLSSCGFYDKNAVPAGCSKWAIPFITPYWKGGYLPGLGVEWHPGRKALIVFALRNDGMIDLLQIDPVNDTTVKLPMGGTPLNARYHAYGRFRLMPGDPDTVVFSALVGQDMYIARLPGSGTPALIPNATSTSVSTPQPQTGTLRSLSPSRGNPADFSALSAGSRSANASHMSGYSEAAGPAPTPTPSPGRTTRQPSAGTVFSPPGQALPFRQWVERINGANGEMSANCSNFSDSNSTWDAEQCGFPPGKHTRAFYNPLLKGLVTAGGDHPVGMPHSGQYDATGSEILLYRADLEKWTRLRPFCVPGEVQPGRPDNVVWAFDAKRNRAIMTPGSYFLYGSGCGSLDGLGAYAFDFKTKTWIGPDDPAIAVPPPGGWGGDNGATYGVIDPVNDELLRIRNSQGLERMNLATKIWRTTPLAASHTTFRSELALDVQGRALYYLAPYGVTAGDAPRLVKVRLDAPNDGKETFINLPWPFQRSACDCFLAFDPINRIIFVPNNTALGFSLSGLGIYHVDTGVWEWEDVPPEVAGSLYGFDENIGALVGLGKRTIPYATYIYKYGGRTLKLVPPAPAPPPIQTTPTISESFNKSDSTTLGPNRLWTQVEGALQVLGQQLTFVTSQVWSSARAEADLASPDMEVWGKLNQLDSSGTVNIEPQAGVAARFNAATKTYYALIFFRAECPQCMRIYKVVNGVKATLAEVTVNDYNPGSEIRLRVTGIGSSVTLTGFLDGKIKLTATDTAADRITSGTRAGVVGYGLGTPLGGYRWFFDDWKAGTAVAP